MTSITIELPDDLARIARSTGVLEPAWMERVIEAAVRVKKAANFMQTASELHAQANSQPQLSETDIQDQVYAIREELRRAAGH